MFPRLYIALQVQDGDIEDLFNHETRKAPPSLAKDGEIGGGTKSDLLTCLEAVSLTPIVEPKVNATAPEGSILVNISKPGKEKTFKGYAEKVFFPIVKSELAQVDRVDVVLVTYRKDSLQATARKKRGKVIRRKVEANTQPPKNWASFLRIDENKIELFRFLSKSAIDAAKTVMNIFSAFDEEVICTRDHNLANLSPCTQEEGDTRVFSQNGLQQIKL